ncbi:MAG: FadR family transcriptional regulator [Sphingomonadaceae bacterium]|nr:FadR family transcriptional regulator [Sphingomonadaceae bacterium]
MNGDRATDRRRTRVAKLIEQLEALSLEHGEGELIGAEDALLARFGVSRPTLRQAAKVVESDRLIAVRRGLRGGFYATRPDAADAIRAPARYLRLHDATLKQMHLVSRLLMPEVAALAALCRDVKLRADLQAIRDQLAGRDGEGDSIRDMIDSEVMLGSTIVRMTANPVMVLMNQISFAFGGLERDLKFYRVPADRRESRRLQLALCGAVLAHDEIAARAVAIERSLLVAAWIG